MLPDRNGRAPLVPVGTTVFALLLLCPIIVLWLWQQPPELIRVGAGYAAKTVCSNVFVAHRNVDDVLRADVQAPGHPLLKLMRVRVDRERGTVRAGLFGFIGNGLAVARPGAGCTVLPAGKLSDEHPGGAGRHGVQPAPVTQDAAHTLRAEPPVQKVIMDDALAGPGMRAIVVVQDGYVVAERYGDGFTPDTPQLGWSMTKTVTAGIVGSLIQEGRLNLNRRAGWRAGDARSAITLRDLMSMSSGLEFNEGYGAVSDATRMLYLESDMAAFARGKPLSHAPGAVWTYSSGSAVIVSSIIQSVTGGHGAAYARTHLFDVIGMMSAVLESDAADTPVGSSYMYATPRDWARFGELLAQDGVWQGRQILPPGFVAMMAEPVPASAGEYGKGMVWRLLTPRRGGNTPDAVRGMPGDVFWMAGHDGQYVAVIPSRRLVIVRMGLTPARLHYGPERLVSAVLGAR